MRAHLRATLQGLNDVGLNLVEQYALTLLAEPTFTAMQRPRSAILSLLKTPPQQADLFTRRIREPYFVVDRAMNTTCVSRALQRLLDVPATKLLGESWMDVVDGEDELRLVNEKWLIAAQTKQGFTHSVRCRTGSGSTVFLFMRVEPFIHPKDQTFEGFFGVCRALTFPLTMISNDEQEQTA